jgi:hypothetical protein
MYTKTQRCENQDNQWLKIVGFKQGKETEYDYTHADLFVLYSVQFTNCTEAACYKKNCSMKY